MIRQRHKRNPRLHLALLVNKTARFYQEKLVSRLISRIRSKGGSYTVYEPESATALLRQAEVAAGLRRPNRNFPAPFARGGKVTGLVACGGDGTFNLVARAGMRAELPIGFLPMGKYNNIAASLIPNADASGAIQKIVSGQTRKIDSGLISGQTFFGSVGLGFAIALADELDGRQPPRLGIGWSQIGSKAAAAVTLKSTVVKVGSFRFEVRPVILNISLLSRTVGLPFSPASVVDDGQAEVIFDTGTNVGNFSGFTRQVASGKYLYGSDILLFRGRVIGLEQVKGRKLYLDGEIVDLPADMVEIKVEKESLQVYA